MSKQEITVLVRGETKPYFVDRNTLENLSLREFLETMPYEESTLMEVVGDNRVSINGVEIDVQDWYTTPLRSGELFIAILGGGVVAGQYP